MKYLQQFEDTSIWRKREKKTVNRFLKAAEEMKIDKAVNFAIKNCQDFINHPFRMVRGITMTSNDGDDNNKLLDIYYSKPVKRWSRDNSNHYTLMLDNLPEWKLFPKRTKSFICSLGKKQIGDEEYIVIPIDGSMWGIAPASDIFQAFKKGTSEYLGFSYDIDNFFNILANIYKDQTKEELNDKNFKIFKNEIKSLDDYIEIPNNNRQYELLSKILENGKLFKKIRMMMSPTLNNFRLLSWQEIYNESVQGNWKQHIDKISINSYNECWTDSPCLFINDRLSFKFIQKLEKKTGKKIRQKNNRL